ncbi:hypothetical protein [Yunchengibacter salinarum]|uniref:hypothetical protein n=1 Tax=Yunchengibacter salinarum TaxID=3133399 RepID=UPI0035B5F099
MRPSFFAALRWRDLYFFALFPLILLALKGLEWRTGTAWRVDLAGVNALIGASFALMAASLSHGVYLLLSWADGARQARASSRVRIFWVAATLLFLLLFLDAALGLHERMGLLGLPEVSLFLVEGALLGGVLALRRFRLPVPALGLLGLFAVLAGSAILGDMSAGGEGVVRLFGLRFSFEQSFETFGLFALMAAFLVQARADLMDQWKLTSSGRGA